MNSKEFSFEDQEKLDRQIIYHLRVIRDGCKAHHKRMLKNNIEYVDGLQKDRVIGMKIHTFQSEWHKVNMKKFSLI